MNTYASSQKEIYITSNIQSLIPLKKGSQISKFYSANILKFSLESPENVQLIETQDALAFWMPP